MIVNPLIRSEVAVVQKTRCLALCSVLAVVVTLSIACASKSPEEKVAAIRALYSARLNGFIIEEEPLPVSAIGPEELGDPAAADQPAAEPESPAESEASIDEGLADAVSDALPVPVRQRARLDLLIQHDSYDRLAGVTVDISMANSAGEEKGHWRVWFDTADVGKASVTQFTHVLEDLSYEEGDGFFAEIRKPIPPEERSEYREFSEGLGDS